MTSPIPTIVLMALITQTYGGNMSVVPNLSAHDCAVAACVAKDGRSCEEEKSAECVQ